MYGYVALLMSLNSKTKLEFSSHSPRQMLHKSRGFACLCWCSLPWPHIVIWVWCYILFFGFSQRCTVCSGRHIAGLSCGTMHLWRGATLWLQRATNCTLKQKIKQKLSTQHVMTLMWIFHGHNRTRTSTFSVSYSLICSLFRIAVSYLDD